MDDDIDGYFDNDLILDEHTLALLDQQEKKYSSQIPQQQAVYPSATKKLKTRDGWSPGIGARTRQDDDFEDLPEVSITADGTYNFTDTPVAPPVRIPPLPKPVSHRPQRVIASPVIRSTTPSRLGTPVQQQPVNHSLRSSWSRNSIQPTSNQLKRTTEKVNGNLEQQLSQLQEQLQELGKQNERMQTALKEATDIRYAKEGEVTILRKHMEKSAQNHITELAKLKLAKEQSDAKQQQLERALKEETERLKTQYIFKQHELEASLKRPASLRAAKINKTPLTTPSRNSVQKPFGDDQSSQLRFQDTPIHTPRGHLSMKNNTRPPSKSPEKLRKTVVLPGFQNSFLSTPSRIQPRFDDKGKGKESSQEELIEDPNHAPSQRNLFMTIPLVRTGWDLSDDFDTAPSSDDVIPFDDNEALVYNGLPEDSEVEPIEPRNRKSELCHLLMTHTHQTEVETTLQLIIGAPYTEDFSIAHTKKSTQSCHDILAAFSDLNNDRDYFFCLDLVAKSLLSVLEILSDYIPSHITPAIFNLLSWLTLMLPTFNKAVIQHNVSGSEDSHILVIMCKHVEKSSDPISDDINQSIVGEILSFLEVLNGDIPEGMVEKIRYLPEHLDCFMALLCPSHPPTILIKLSRVFMFLTTYDIVHERLATPDDKLIDGIPQQESAFISGICNYLTDAMSSGTYEENIPSDILLACLAQLSRTRIEALLQSHVLIPSLIYIIAQLTSALWNGDEQTVPNGQDSRLVRLINQAVFLLHWLVNEGEHNVYLSQKIQQAPEKFNNLIHMFTVSFGQLSYSDPPDWVDPTGKLELEALSDPARELFDLIVDGPEGDSVWAAFQIDPENEIDEEEREAMLMEDEMQS